MPYLSINHTRQGQTSQGMNDLTSKDPMDSQA
jgi:hypothetical protein